MVVGVGVLPGWVQPLGLRAGPRPGRTVGPATASGLGPSPIPVLRPQKSLHVPGGDGHRGKSLKLLEKIPEDAEATVVLVGTRPGADVGCRAGGPGVWGEWAWGAASLQF